ncbi:MAG TPA: GGDEF domain-containing protein [Thermoanaerobaculia bacterium]|nr:GGDEF domain-containing protein [Thermoanaerobaculia bacterium]HUM31130.1 GGDEF domain-containing protein [Thermoanaerobaculia bacterium]HXK69471.1 GGDEF domain-containing protein [Thermoanaerobaculia bacterium]
MLILAFLTKDENLEATIQSLASPNLEVRPFAEEGEQPFAHIWIVDVTQPAPLPQVPRAPFFKVILTEEEPEQAFSDPDTLHFSRADFQDRAKNIIDLLKRFIPLAREKKVLEREIEVLKTVETLYLTQEQDKAFSQLIYAVADLLETEPTGMILLRDPKKSAYDEHFPLEERRKGRRPRHTFHPEFLDEILFSSEPYSIVDDPNGPDQKLVGFPIRNDQVGLGIIFVPIREQQVSKDRLLVASKFAAELSSILENLLLFMETKELTIKDDLTQAYNRRYFEAFVDEELERAKRYGSRFSLIFLDLDDLKQVNNQYGHLMGSRTLQEVSKRILKAVRHVDRVVRFGGDEFCIILPHTEPEEAITVAERVRHSINGSVFSLSPGVEVIITASFGVAGYPEHGKTKESLIAKADQAMYEIKTQRKNGVKLADITKEA